MTNPMTRAEMLARLERVIRLDDFYISSGKTDPEYDDYQMDSGQRWEIEAVIEALRAELEAEKPIECFDSPLKKHMWLAASEIRNQRIYKCQFCTVETTVQIKDKDHA